MAHQPAEQPDPVAMAHYTLWAAAHEHDAEPPTIDAAPAKPRGKRMSEWTVKESLCALFALVVLGFVVPFVILFGGIIGLAVWDHITAP